MALHSAPFHAWLGIKVVDLNERSLTLEMPWRAEIVSNPNIQSMHGGVLASLVDLAGFYAILSRTRLIQATSDLQVDYIKAATPGPIRAQATVVKLGKSVSIARTDVTDEGGTLLAAGRGAYLMRTT